MHCRFGSRIGGRMRRNKTIINLYDEPLYPRPTYSGRNLEPSARRRPLMSYFVLMGAVLYCVIYLVDGVSGRRIPSHASEPDLQQSQAVQVLSALDAPAPDMSSEEVRFAEADATVSRAQQKAPADARKEAMSRDAKEPVKAIASALKKKKVHIARKPKAEDGFQAFAFGFGHSRPPYGGY
jgi:hypothetical protein